MSTNSILKKEGISVICQLNIFEVNRIAKHIANIISENYSEYFLNQSDLFSLISRINMYLAKMPQDSYAKYCYQNNSIYFNENIDLANSKNLVYILHECLHRLQEKRDESGTLYKLGLYDINKTDLALNEAAVQYMACKAERTPVDNVKYYDVYINTISPDSYPLQCTLLNEMLYFTGTYPLYHSTLNANDIFKNTFISCSNKKTYETISTNLDKILKLEDDLYYYNLDLANSSNKNSKLLNNIIAKTKSSIKNIFFETQNLIIQTCFTKEFSNLKTIEEVKSFQSKLYNFKDIIGYSDDYTYYNEYYCNTMQALEGIRETLEEGKTLADYRSENTSLVAVTSKKVNLFKRAFQKIKKLFSFNKQRIADNINNIN